MKLSTTAIFAVAAVGALRLVQRERHQRQLNEVAVAQIQINRLTHLTSHPELAASWAPTGMDTKEYVKILDANQQLCALSLRHKLGITTGRRLRFVAEWIMDHEVGRRYWERFGSLRAEETMDDSDAAEFNEAMNDAYMAHPKAQPASV
ncbi:DUF6082 family protein [Streptomyces kronopolitis]|uniref:DUF6082 family protein n=1 Tax=Streptomyces kronopolitis TaxID=1612435 RepID=UPI003D99FC3F